MSEYCDIQAILTHPNKPMRKRLVTAYRRGSVAQEFVPLPGKLVRGDSQQHRIERELHWGTPEDFGQGDYSAAPVCRGNRIELQFETVKGPPLGVFIALRRLGFSVEAGYWEPSAGFCGYLRDDKFDESEIRCWNPACVRRHLDAALVKQFAIDDGRFHYEDKPCDHDGDSLSYSRGRSLEEYFAYLGNSVRANLTIWRALRCDA